MTGTESGSHDRLAGQSGTILDGQEYTLSVDEAAALLGKSVETVRRYARSGRLPSMRVQGERIIEYRFRPDDLRGSQSGTHDRPGSRAVMPTRADGYPDDRAMTAFEHTLAPLLTRLSETLHANEHLHTQLVQVATEKGELAGQLAAKDELIAELRRQLARRDQRPSYPWWVRVFLR